MRRITVTALALALSCAIPARAADDQPAPPPPSKSPPIASAPALRSLPSLDPPHPAAPTAPAPCVARPLTGPRFRAGAITSNLWPNGTNLRIYFHGGDERVIARVLADWEDGWGADANLTLTRTADPRQSHIRCTFQRGGGNWSLIGRGALTQPGQPTMNLNVGPETPADEVYRLGEHEIGHAIGFEHNMSLPDAEHRLDKGAMIRWMMQTQGWSYQQSAAQVQEVMATALHPRSRVDYDSIMQYPVPALADRKRVGVGWIKRLSAGDRQSARDFYPGRRPTGDTTTPAPGTTTPGPGTAPPSPGTAPPSPGTPSPTPVVTTIRSTYRPGSVWSGTLNLDAKKAVVLKVRVIGPRPAPAPTAIVSPVGSPWSSRLLAMDASAGEGKGEDEGGTFEGRFRAGPGRYVVVVGFGVDEEFEFEVSAAR